MNSQKLPVATANAWFANSSLGYQATLQWVSVCPKYQGLGLGRAVVTKAMSLFPKLNPSQDVLLHTQTWSHKAIGLYHSIGFDMTKQETVAIMRNDGQGAKIHKNDFSEAIQVLKSVMSTDLLNALLNTAK
ncbi:MAG: N-acetyltransferase [Firmicutes bacterium]|nr:N-acetyltransferase [Bacillota bacterium]